MLTYALTIFTVLIDDKLAYNWEALQRVAFGTVIKYIFGAIVSTLCLMYRYMFKEVVK